MPLITKTICVDQPISDVFRYLANASLWPQWNPCSVRASGNVERFGGTIVEHVHIGSWEDQVTWTVRRLEVPGLLLLSAKIRGLGETRQKFTLRKVGERTLIEREFQYESPSSFFAPIEQLFVRHKIEQQLTEALDRLKEELEKKRSATQGDAHRARLLHQF